MRKTSTSTLGLLAFALMGQAPSAPSVECQNPTPADPAVQYPAHQTGVIAFCAPMLDVRGEPLAADELIGVRIYVDGELREDVNATPGLYLRVLVSDSYPKFGTLILESYGPGPRDDRSQTPLYQARFHRRGPAKPVLLP